MNRVKIKKLLCLLLSLVLICEFSGCSEDEPKNPNTLWIVTEETSEDGMVGQIENVIRSFEEKHEGVIIELEVLPQAGHERETRLEKLHVAIMAGKGPDGFLLPTNISDQVPLFLNVDQAMRNGLFADISQYYNEDETLGKEGLLDTVLSVGVVDEARYILPLRYDFPVIYADTELLKVSGLDASVLSSNVNGYLNEIIENGNENWINSASLMKSSILGHFAYFSKAVDYDQGEVVLNKASLDSYLHCHQNLIQLCGENYPYWVGDLISYLGSAQFFDESHPFEVSTMSSAYEYAAISKLTGQDIEAIPLRSVEGEIIASVTYFAAVGAGSSNPEMTYAFLREFLSEKSQWEQNRVTTFRYAAGLIADGWPVRCDGAVEPLWNICRIIHRTRREENPLLKVELTDNDVPILGVTIDKVRISNGFLEYQILGSKLAMLNDPVTGLATDVDISTIADEIINELEHYLAEG